MKWLGSDAVDGSLLSLIAPLAVFDADEPIAAATVAAVEADLEHQLGIHRYLDDTFFGGGRWPLLSCFAGLAHARLGNREVERDCALEAAQHALLDRATERLGLSARAYHRVLRVARTIADLAGDARIEAAHLAEAIQYRRLDGA